MPRKTAAKEKARTIENGFELKEVKPLTANQEIAFKEYAAGKQLMLTGVAGTGKSFLAL